MKRDAILNGVIAAVREKWGQAGFVRVTFFAMPSRRDEFEVGRVDDYGVLVPLGIGDSANGAMKDAHTVERILGAKDPVREDG